MKQCSNCKQEKDLSQFYKASKEKDGYQYRCKTCGKCIRGILCRECNLLIGYLELKREHIPAAVRYIGGAT